MTFFFFLALRGQYLSYRKSGKLNWQNEIGVGNYYCFLRLWESDGNNTFFKHKVRNPKSQYFDVLRFILPTLKEFVALQFHGSIKSSFENILLGSYKLKT